MVKSLFCMPPLSPVVFLVSVHALFILADIFFHFCCQATDLKKIRIWLQLMNAVISILHANENTYQISLTLKR